MTTNVVVNTVIIDTNSALPLLSSQKFVTQQGFSPADDSVQTLNPPLFRWPYVEDPYQTATMTDPRTFLFQLSTNAGATFSSTQWSVTTSNNFFNRIPAVTNADGSVFTGTNYWRIVYMLSNAVTVVSTSAVHHFTLNASATNWDRSMLADSNYLYSALSVHPHMWFTTSNRTAVSTYMQTVYSASGASAWTTISNEAVQAVTNSWFTNETSFTSIGAPGAFLKAYQLWEVAFVYQMTTNAYLASFHPENFLDAYDRFWISQGYDRQPTYGGSDYTQDQNWALSIDYLWPLMSTAQRSNAVYAVEQSVKFYTYEDWWYEGSTADPTRAYPQSGWKVNTDAAPKGGDSHQRFDLPVALTMCLSLWAESTNLQAMLPYYMDFVLGKKDSPEGDEGRGYNNTGTLVEPYGGLGADIMTTTLFPHAKLWLNPLYAQTVAQYSYMEPVFYHGLLEPWGDLDYGAGPNDTMFYNQYASGLELGMVTQNGAAVRQFNRQNPTGFREGGGTPQFEALIGYYYSTPSESNWSSTATIDPLRGYATFGSLQPNDFGAFTNGVGFTTQARPDAHVNHGMWSDGSIQLWAYGAQISAGGSGRYQRHPMIHSAAILVDGIGVNIPRGNPTEAWYARFTAFTNSTDFSFIASETEGAYNRSNFTAQGAGSNLISPFYDQGTNKRPYLSGMDRNVLFPHKKYLVLYDSMTSTQPAQFEWGWHYMETNNSVVNTNGCSFNYTATNAAGSNVTVYVFPFVDSSTMTLTNMPGTNNYLINPFTGEDYSARTDFSPAEPLPNGTIWVYNKAGSTNWHFGNVVYAARWDEPAPPTFTRLDDNTVRVTGYTNDNSAYPGNWVQFTDTNTFGTNFSGPSNFKVDFTSDGSGAGGGSSGDGGSGSAVSIGHVTIIRANTMKSGH